MKVNSKYSHTIFSIFNYVGITKRHKRRHSETGRCRKFKTNRPFLTGTRSVNKEGEKLNIDYSTSLNWYQKLIYSKKPDDKKNSDDL